MAISNCYYSPNSQLQLSRKESARKWSKKELLGHLIDSKNNNLQRFTDIQFERNPYIIRNHNHN